MKHITALVMTILITLVMPVYAYNEVTEPQLDHLVEEEPVVAEKPQQPKKKELTLAQKIAQDINNCEPDKWISAEDASCLEKTAAESATPQPNVTSSIAVGTCESYRSLVAQYDWNVDTMMYAMQAESGCNPNAVGDQYVIGGIYAPSCGLLQVRTLAGRPSCEALKDPATNIATSYQIWLSQGYSAWTTLH